VTVTPDLHALRTAVASARQALLGAATDSAEEAERARLAAAAERLANSVLRPLDAALGSRAQDAAVVEAPTFWDLARRATVLRSRPGAPPELLEVAHAIANPAARAAHSAWLREHRAALQRLADARYLRPLLALTRADGSTPDFLRPTPSGPLDTTAHPDERHSAYPIALLEARSRGCRLAGPSPSGAAPFLMRRRNRHASASRPESSTGAGHTPPSTRVELG
jgi:hypothetical protein